MARFTEKQRLQIKKDRDRKRKSGNKNASVNNVYVTKKYRDGGVKKSLEHERVNDGDPTVRDHYLTFNADNSYTSNVKKRKNPDAKYPNRSGKKRTEIKSRSGAHVSGTKKVQREQRARVLKKIREFE
jgi:hypothetical protein